MLFVFVPYIGLEPIRLNNTEYTIFIQYGIKKYYFYELYFI